VELGVTSEAAHYISERGSRLYLWQEAVGKSWASDRVAFEDPNRGTRFASFQVGGISILMADDLERPKRLRVKLDRLPRHRLHIDWDGTRWGWRGEATGGS
jgi:hypothetical protein